MNISSWISPKTQKALPSTIHELGFFAIEDIAKGEMVAIKAGHLIDRKTLEENMDVIQHSQMQIAEDVFIAPMSLEELPQSMIYFNHSCEPNLVIDGQVVLIAFRDIRGGEELTVDYGTIFDGDEELACHCGTASCRHVVTGKDWQSPPLQEKYVGHFAWFLEQKIGKR